MLGAVLVSWSQDAGVRASGRQRALGPHWPTVEQPQPRWERSAPMVRRTWIQYSSLSLSPTHLSHTTNITLSRIKCERLYFIWRSVFVRSLNFVIMFDYVSHIFVYIHVQLYYGYTTLRWVTTLSWCVL